MADTSTTFSVEIGETGGEDAASSLEALRAKIVADTAALREMQAAMRNMKGGTSINVDAFKQLRDQIAAQKESLAASSAEMVNMGGGFGAVKKGAADAGAGANAAGAAIDALPRPLGKVAREGQKLGELFKSLGAAGPWVALAAAVVIVTTAIIAGTVAVVAWAVGLADAKRNADLVTEGLAASSKNLAGLAGILPGVQAATGATTASLQKMAEQLDAAGVSAKDMPYALKALATATAGGASSAAIAKLNADLKSGTKTAKQLAEEMQKTFGPIVAKKMMSLDGLSSRLKTGISGIFGGLKIEGLLEGLSKLVDLFDANTASGKAMKALFEGIFQPIVDAVTAALPTIKILFLTMVLYALKARAAIRPVIEAISALLPAGSGAKVLVAILKGLGIVFAGVAISIAFALAPLILFVAAVVAVGAAIAVLIDWLIDAVSSAGDFASSFGSTISDAVSAAWDSIVSGARAAWDAVMGVVQSAIDAVSSIDMVSVGADLIGGLVSGIVNAGPRVLTALTGLVGNAVTAVKGMLGIHSDSTVFKGIAGHMAGGMKTGLAANENGVADAAGGLADAAIGGASGGGSSSAPARSASSSGGGIVIEHLEVNVNGVAGAEDPAFHSKVMAAVATALEIELAKYGLSAEAA